MLDAALARAGTPPEGRAHGLAVTLGVAAQLVQAFHAGREPVFEPVEIGLGGFVAQQRGHVFQRGLGFQQQRAFDLVDVAEIVELGEFVADRDRAPVQQAHQIGEGLVGRGQAGRAVGRRVEGGEQVAFGGDGGAPRVGEVSAAHGDAEFFGQRRGTFGRRRSQYRTG